MVEHKFTEFLQNDISTLKTFISLKVFREFLLLLGRFEHYACLNFLIRSKLPFQNYIIFTLKQSLSAC